MGFFFWSQSEGEKNEVKEGGSWKAGMDRGKKRGREGGKEGETEGVRDGGREGGREGEREEGEGDEST